MTMLTTITTWFAAIPPVVIVVFGGLAYIRLMDGRYHWPMLIDAGLAVWYLLRPSVFAWALLLIVVRNVPTFAAIVATTFKLDEWQGWSTHVILFVLPGLRVFASAPQERVGAFAPLPPAIGPTVALPSPAPAQAPLRPAEWLGAVNDDATAPHLGVVGPTRLGKTTFVLAALGRRAGRLVVTTPKGADTDPWDGVAAHRLRADLDARGYDWSPIASAIDGVHYEMLRRNATAKAKDAEQITLVVDELSTALANCERRARQQILELWNMGAGAGIRLVVIDPEVSAAAWGIEGRRDILSNLIFARVEDGRAWSLGRLDRNGRLIDPQLLDTTQLIALSEQAQLAGREWVGVGVPPLPPPAGASQTQTHGTHTPTNDREERIAKYVEWRRAKLTREQGRVIRQGSGEGLDDTE